MAFRQFFSSLFYDASREAAKKTPYHLRRPPVPRITLSGKKDPLSQLFRNLDNAAMVTVPPYEVASAVYINTNEDDVDKASKRLLKFPQTKRGFHVGFSGGHNLSMMALRKSIGGIIFDVNPENALYINQLLEILKTSKNRFEFVNKLKEFVKKSVDSIECQNTPSEKLTLAVKFFSNISSDPLYDELLLNGKDCISEQISVELKLPNSWLFTDERFEYIKSLAVNDKIVAITEDILNSNTFGQLANLMRDNDQRIDSVYVSNIARYIPRGSVGRFLATINHLLFDDNTLVIDAYQNPIVSQRVRTAGAIKSANVEAWHLSVEEKEQEALRQVSSATSPLRSF